MSTIDLSKSDLDYERFFREIGPFFDAASTDSISESSLAAFLVEAGHVLEMAAAQDREQNRIHAHRFNLLSWIEPDENKLSDILADLLDPSGRHGQGMQFLRLLFEHLHVALPESWTGRTTTRREAPTHGIAKYRRRIDILIESSAIVGIENKIDSLEQHDQIKDYLDHLRFLAMDSGKPAILIYLTPNGRYPTSIPPQERLKLKEAGQLRCWSYSGELTDWLRACQVWCEADKMRFFLADFVDYIKTTLKRIASIEEDEESQ